MNILGINIGHDRAAAIVKDGKIVSYIAEERLDRVKHSFSEELPSKAIQYVLDLASLDFESIDFIGISSPILSRETLQQLVNDKLFSRFSNLKKASLQVVGHHMSHACTAYYCSSYNEAAIWIADGGGDYDFVCGEEAESYYTAKSNEIKHLYTRFQARLIPPEKIFSPDLSDIEENISLGRKYEQITHLLGFKFGECGKTMGLSSYGKDRRRWRHSPRIINRFEPDLKVGHFILSLLEDLNNVPLAELASDVAAEIQALIEECALLCLKNLQQVTGSSNLCIAGGVGLNCVLNSKIAQDSGFSSIFIFPCAGDEGQAIGNALFTYFNNGGKKRLPLQTASFGKTYSEGEIASIIAQFNLKASYHKDIFDQTATLLANGAIVGWFQGGSEGGPRSLGFRSILADPRDPEMKHILNNKVKHRESFRPFAPAILSEYALDYFSYPQSDSLAFMLLTAEVLEDKKSLIPSVVHIDGSARLQIVTEDSSFYLYKLIHAFLERTGIPVLLNTSFNVAGEPIVETPTDAIRCFLSTEIDYLSIGNFLLTK